jgi:hypothetical protein
LKNKELNPKIPTCSQLEEINETQLTVEQTNKSRLVTKCRFIIEKKIGEIKKNKALDNRQNNEVNHLQFDYRITCALINYTHKSCCADKGKAQELSQKIKDKIENTHLNHLESLNKIQLGTKKNPLIQFADLTDFPILSLEEMEDEIFFGSYFLKQSRSYFSDIIKTGFYTNITDTLLRTFTSIDERAIEFLSRRLEHYKIIGMKLNSRHSRSLKKKKKITIESSESDTDEKTEMEYRFNYKVFIEYEKDLNQPSAIKSKIFSIINNYLILKFKLFKVIIVHVRLAKSKLVAACM